jgi:hypothetical protein
VAFGPIRSILFQFNCATLGPKTRCGALGPSKYVIGKSGVLIFFYLANTGPAFYM